MSKNIDQCIQKCFDTFKPRPRFELHKIEDLEPNYVKHKLKY